MQKFIGIIFFALLSLQLNASQLFDGAEYDYDIEFDCEFDILGIDVLTTSACLAHDWIHRILGCEAYPFKEAKRRIIMKDKLFILSLAVLSSNMSDENSVKNALANTLLLLFNNIKNQRENVDIIISSIDLSEFKENMRLVKRLTKEEIKFIAYNLLSLQPFARLDCHHELQTGLMAMVGIHKK